MLKMVVDVGFRQINCWIGGGGRQDSMAGDTTETGIVYSIQPPCWYESYSTYDHAVISTCLGVKELRFLNGFLKAADFASLAPDCQPASLHALKVQNSYFSHKNVHLVWRDKCDMRCLVPVDS